MLANEHKSTSCRSTFISSVPILVVILYLHFLMCKSSPGDTLLSNKRFSLKTMGKIFLAETTPTKATCEEPIYTAPWFTDLVANCAEFSEFGWIFPYLINGNIFFIIVER